MKQNWYIDHFYNLAVKAGFYGNAGRVIGFFHEIKQCTLP